MSKNVKTNRIIPKTLLSFLNLIYVDANIGDGINFTI